MKTRTKAQQAVINAKSAKTRAANIALKAEKARAARAQDVTDTAMGQTRESQNSMMLKEARLAITGSNPGGGEAVSSLLQLLRDIREFDFEIFKTSCYRLRATSIFLAGANLVDAARVKSDAMDAGIDERRRQKIESHYAIVGGTSTILSYLIGEMEHDTLDVKIAVETQIGHIVKDKAFYKKTLRVSGLGRLLKRNLRKHAKRVGHALDAEEIKDFEEKFFAKEQVRIDRKNQRGQAKADKYNEVVGTFGDAIRHDMMHMYAVADSNSAGELSSLPVSMVTALAKSAVRAFDHVDPKGQEWKNGKLQWLESNLRGENEDYLDCSDELMDSWEAQIDTIELFMERVIEPQLKQVQLQAQQLRRSGTFENDPLVADDDRKAGSGEQAEALSASSYTSKFDESEEVSGEYATEETYDEGDNFDDMD